MANQPTKYKKFVATAATATLVASAIVPVASAATTFPDVPADDQYSVAKAVELGLMNGYANGNFGYTDSVKRSQVVLVLGRLLEQAGVTADADYATDKAFSDVSSDELLKYGNIVKKSEVFTGYTDGTLKPNNNINRENLAAVLDRAAKAISGVSLVELAEAIEDKEVSDLGTALSANRDAIQALRDLEISTVSTFNPKGDIQRRHFAKFAVTAIEVIESASLSADKVKEIVASADKAAAELPSTVSRDEASIKAAEEKVEAAKAAVEAAEKAVAISTKLTADEKATAEKTIEAAKAKIESTEKAIAEAKAPVSELAVTSVVALNATQLEVKFNAELDGDDLESSIASLVTLTGESIVDYDLDKDTVVITFADSIEGTNKVLEVQPLRTVKYDENNQQVLTKKYVQVFNYKDTVKPEITAVKATTKDTVATSITVTASEPIASVAVVKVNGQTVSANFNGTNKATINGVNLSNTGTHTVEVINLTDKAAEANVTVSASKTFTVTTDVTKPTVTASAKSEKTILLTFSKSMNAATVANNVSLSDERLTSVPVSSITAVAGSDNKEFEVKVTDTLFTNATTRKLTVLVSENVTDSLGNKLDLTTTSVTLTKDVVKPAATGYKLVKDSDGKLTQIVVEFSEPLAAQATVAVPSVVNSNGVLVTNFMGGLTAQPVAANDKKVTYTVTTPAVPTGTYAFGFAAELVSDTAETANKSAAFNYTINFGSSAGTITLPADSVTESGNTFVVDFTTPVKGGAVANSATDVNNYKLNGSALPAGTSIVLNGSQDQATITLPTIGSITVDDTYVLSLANITALDGRIVNAHQESVAVLDNTKPVLTAGNIVNGDLLLSFSEAVTGVDATDFEFKINDVVVAPYTVNAITSGADKGKYAVSFRTVADSGKLFVDVDNSGTYTAADTVQLGTTSAADGTVTNLDLNYGLVTAVKVSVKSNSDIKDASAAQNPITTDTVITVK